MRARDQTSNSRGVTPLINEFEDMLNTALSSAAAEIGREITSEEIEAYIEDAHAVAASVMMKSLLARERSHAAAVKADYFAFSVRNQRRWRPALDAIESLYKASFEIGEAFNKHHRPAAASVNDFQFEALVQLHGKCLLVTRECITLVRHGFAEGALSRWRTLHEYSVISSVLIDSDLSISERYLLSFHFQVYKAAKQIERYIGKGTKDSFSDKEIEDMRLTCERISKRLGSSLARDYDWAKPIFPCKSEKAVVKFSDLEALTRQDALRPYYAWASRHTHAGYTPPGKGLGLSESDENVILIGPSNSGMVDPLQLTALAVSHVTANLLACRPSFDSSVQTSIVAQLASRIGSIAQKAEADSLMRHKRKTSHNCR